MIEETAGPSEVRTVPMPAETLVMDKYAGEQLLRFDGLVPLPLGARIELGRDGIGPARDAVVIEVRVWGASSPRSALVLDCKVVDPGGHVQLP